MAPANDPIADPIAIAKTVLQLEKTGVFDAAVEIWNRKAEADQTMAEFRRHLRFENK